MMRTERLHFLLLVVFTLSGCVYKAPISFTPSREIDRSLLGTWQLADEPDSRLTIAEADRTHYKVDVRPPEGNPLNVGPTNFRAHHTRVGKIDIINLQHIDSQSNRPGDWGFASYIRPDNENLHVRTVNERVIPTPFDPGGELLTTPEAMKRHFESVVNRPDLFSPKEMIFKRIRQ
jgi:hypothetical protein